MSLCTPDESRLLMHSIPPARPVPDLLEDVSRGLLHPPRCLPPKYFYDDLGSQLFDAICDTPEYYVTRTENALLQAHAADVIARVRPTHLIEFGSGTARKTRHLFDQCAQAGQPAAYWPFDVCAAMLQQSGEHLLQEYDWLQVNALVGDYCAGLHHLPRPQGPCLYLFLGGTIGNFSAQQALGFLREVRAGMGPSDRLLLGADRVKAPEILHAAYNDEAGITARFNLNVLDVLNREVDAGFDVNAFHHQALFNQEAQQIEMYLVSEVEQKIPLEKLHREICLQAGERILTEISRKFTVQGLQALLAQAGFSVEEHYEPENRFFSLVLAAPFE